MSFGVTGDMKKAHALLDEAIGRNPERPLNYCNRACAFAEEGHKSKALVNLDLALQRKANILTRHSRNQTGKLVTMPEWASNY
jgi:Tfp pilus assembly protein PilF